MRRNLFQPSPGKVIQAGIKIFGLLFFGSSAFSQKFTPPNPTVPSGSLGSSFQAIQISNDLYNGKINTLIPLFSCDFGGLSFPIGLTYTGGNGIKQDEIPSWVGYGWNLQTMGYIHRAVRGKPDEARDFKTTIIASYSCSNPGTVLRKKKTDLNSTDYSYLSNFNMLNVQNWNSTTYANSFARLNVPGHVNYPCGWEDIYNSAPSYDLVPDEFTFSIGSLSGKFYLNSNGQWLFSSNNGEKYEVQLNTGEQLITQFLSPFTGNTSYYRSPKIIKSIILTSPRGVKFHFGNTDSNPTFANCYWDHTRSSQVYDPFGGSGETFPFEPNSVANTYLDVVPHTWHLTRIEDTKTGSFVKIDYKESGLSYYKTRQMWGGGNQGATNFAYDNSQLQYLDDLTNEVYQYRPSILVHIGGRSWVPSAITFSSGLKIEYQSTNSSQLLTNESIWNTEFTAFNTNEELWYHSAYSGNVTLQKLDRIDMRFAGQLLKQFSFSYANSYSNRLQLSSVKQILGDNKNEEYSFQYNNANNVLGKLPPHAATYTDHWGFYNNKDYFSSITGSHKSFSNLSTYSNYREPDGIYAQAEILKKVIYPTGGSVEFVYEGNKYSKERNRINFSIANVSSTGLETGGVRIKKIINYSSDNQIASEKEYEYLIPGTSQSSGVLVSPKPEYLSGTYDAWTFFSSGFSPAYYQGNHVTYTYSSEKILGKGKTVYKFTNYDNGFNDEVAANTSVTPLTFEGGYLKNAFKRGKLIQSLILNQAGNVIQEYNLEYEHDLSESNKDELRSLYLVESGSGFSAISEKIYSDHLVSKESKLYSANGNISTKSTHSYDIYGNIKESKSFNSEGQVIREKYRYCYEYTVNGTDYISLGIKNINDMGITDAVIEKITYREKTDGSQSYVIAGAISTYKPGAAFIEKTYSLKTASPIIASSFLESGISNGSFIMDIRYGSIADGSVDSYDGRGNIQQVTTKNGIIESYLWDYGGMYNTAKVINAEQGHIAYTSFESDGTGSWGIAPASISSANKGLTGKKSYDLGGGMWRATDPAKTYILTLWVKGDKPGISKTIPGGSTQVIDAQFDFIASSGQWSLLKGEVQNATGISIWKYGHVPTSYIDEVRLYPKGALMTTYTYSPLTGLTNSCNTSNEIQTYIYDGFGRLLLQRDHDNNIVTRNCYNYADRPENCTIYSNQSQTGSFQKQGCSSAYQGSSVSYTVDGGVYYSIVSQADADQQAINDLNANGQNYVNSFGACLLLYQSTDHSGYYTSQNCQPGEAQPYYISVPYGMFTSTVSLADANNQAIQYAQSQADQYGTCAQMVMLVGDNNAYYGSTIYVIMTNVQTQEQSFFELYPGFGILGSVPSGDYDIEITDYQGWYYRNYSAGCGNFTYGPSAYFYNVTIDNSCNTISVF